MTLTAAVAGSPVLGVPVGSISRRWVSTPARGRCCVPLWTTEISPGCRVPEITDEGWHRAFEIHCLSAMRPARAVTPILEAQGSGGAIINIPTFATFEPDAAFPTSGVARARLAAFTEIYADTYAGQGIRITNVLPGFFNVLPEKEEFCAWISMDRYGRVKEFAGTVAFLAFDTAGYITGQNLRVDRGVTGRCSGAGQGAGHGAGHGA